MFKVHYTRKAFKNLSKIDQGQQRFILSWIEKNLESCEDPRKYGKALKGNMKSYWRYRVGDYRIIAEILDEKIMIVVVNIAHRKDICKR